MKILICDDDREYCEKLYEKVRAAVENAGCKADFDVLFSTDSIFSEPCFYDMAFLDVEMPCKNGFETAELLKKINPHIIIFTVTSFDSYLDDAMDINVFRFFGKNVDEDRLTKGIEKALGLISSELTELSVISGNQAVKIQAGDIVYIEINGRGTLISCLKEKIYSHEKIDYWEKRLNPSFFCRIHKSYILNMKHMVSYKRDEVKVKTGETLPVSYRRQRQFREKFFDFLGE